jgi:hypothetical protein
LARLSRKSCVGREGIATEGSLKMASHKSITPDAHTNGFAVQTP